MQECDDLYRKLGHKVFSQTALKGATGLVWNNSYYNSDNWSKILRETIGDSSFISTNRKEKTPRVSKLRRKQIIKYVISIHLHASMQQPLRLINYFLKKIVHIYKSM